MTKRPKHFRFKQFSVRHDEVTMKVGTDAVLLGAWVDVKDAASILDIGTGSGVIALMLAQRTSSSIVIDGVEIEARDAAVATDNIQQSPWADRVKIYNTAIQQFHPLIQYDLIVSNPPYFNDSQEPPEKRRVEARHTTLLSHEELLSSAIRLLNSSGTFAVILPPTEGLAFINLARGRDLYCFRQWTFRTRAGKPVERVLLSFSFEKRPTDQGEILLYNAENDWSLEYRALTRDFYLKL